MWSQRRYPLVTHLPNHSPRRRSSRRNLMKVLKNPRHRPSPSQKLSRRSPPSRVLEASRPCRSRLARSLPSGEAANLTLVSAHHLTKRKTQLLPKQHPASAPNMVSIKMTTPARSPSGAALVRTECHLCHRSKMSLRPIRLGTAISPRLAEEAPSTSRTSRPSRRSAPSRSLDQNLLLEGTTPNHPWVVRAA